MARYFDLSNSTFRHQALAMLMLLLLIVSLVAARGTMAFRRVMRGPWYRNLMPPEAKKSPVPLATGLPADTATYVLHQRGHHRVMLAFFIAGRNLIVGHTSTKVTASRFIDGLFPKAHGWAAPAPAIVDIMGVPILMWRSYRMAKTPATMPGVNQMRPVRLLVARSTGEGKFRVAVIGFSHGLSIYDRKQLLKLVTGMARGNL